MPDISVAEPAEYRAVLSLLVSRGGNGQEDMLAEQILESHRRGEFPLDGLLKATDDGELIGAELFTIQPDGTAFVWPPAVRRPTAPEAVADALLQDVCLRLDVLNVDFGQCLLDGQQAEARDALLRNGFVHLADLFYLQRPLTQPLPEDSGVPFETVAFSEQQNADRFAAVIERTYIGTLDCPAFHGQRTGAQALESHRASGRFDADRWKIYRVGDRDVGILLLNDHPDQDCWEVVYMGIVPEARGRGYGRAMLLSGLWEARRAGRDAVLLAVDSKNTYANRIYSDLGFSELARRAVYLRHADRQPAR